MQGRPTRQLQSLQPCLEEQGSSQRAREIFYIDGQRLTRECVSRELARCLPELAVEERATARDLALENFDPAGIALVAFNAHAGDVADSGVAAELSILERIVPDVPLVLFSDIDAAWSVIEAFRRGLRGYVPTTLPIRQAAEAIRFVWAGGTFVPLSILSLSSSSNHMDNNPSTRQATISANFSPRQREVLHRLWMGKSNKLIAYELSMCESTVKVHIRQIMKKLNVSNRTQVVVVTRPSFFDGNGSADETELSCAINNAELVRSFRNGPPRQFPPIHASNGVLTKKKGGLGSEC